MSESHSQRGRRRLNHVDNSIVNAQADLYEYYYLLLRADPFLAASVETLLYQLSDIREQIRLLCLAAWETETVQAETIGQINDLIVEARRDVLGKRHLCRAYSELWATLAVKSSQLLEKRAKASHEPSKLRDR